MRQRFIFLAFGLLLAAGNLLVGFGHAADPAATGSVDETAGAPKASSAQKSAPAQPEAKPADKPTEDAASSQAGLKLFDEVHATLVNKCLKCHGGQKTESGFNLANRDGLLKGGENGIDVIAGKAAESELVKLLKHEDDPHMPKDADKLSDKEIASVVSWIDAGAPYSKPLVAAGAPQGHPNVTATDRQFWSFLPLAKAEPPAVKNTDWLRTPIDRFILAPLEEKGIVPNAPADRRVLIRRLYFDLVGLPPTIDEVEAFAKDRTPDAYERLVDRLLDSPHYGERWARHWLDVARYAESHGYEQDYDRPYAFHYRDFVIRALNSDMPYDQFVRWQIAGDEFAPDEADAWMATGFLAAGTHATQITANQAEKERYDELDDQAATVGTAFLGLTVGCARCHDHKYDPIPTTDYYKMIATFTTTVRSDHAVTVNAKQYHEQWAEFEREQKPLVDALVDYDRQTVQPKVEHSMCETARTLAGWYSVATPRLVQVAIANGPDLAVRISDPQYCRLVSAIVVHWARMPLPHTVKALVCSEGLPAIRLHTQGPDYYDTTFQLKRGDLNQKIEPAKPGFLQVLEREGENEDHWRDTPPPGSRTPYNRRALANWITDADAGAGQLLARVIVNRLWQHHFGRGIVATPSDFGAQGLRPTHPELLDWLAGQLIRNGWRLKPLQKLIVTSATYME
ncbi:MAG TPA: PSD1 and planctomycete cytochrome C domain-containing protein, partial [Pirellulales bacterium]